MLMLLVKLLHKDTEPEAERVAVAEALLLPRLLPHAEGVALPDTVPQVLKVPLAEDEGQLVPKELPEPPTLAEPVWLRVLCAEAEELSTADAEEQSEAEPL